MKAKNNLRVRVNTHRFSSFIAFGAGSVLLAFSFLTTLNAQTKRPKPAPTLPEVVSRDSDNVRKTKVEDVREVVDKSDVVKLTKQAPKSTRENSDGTTKKQKKLLLYLDLLTRTEQRAGALQKQLYELIEKQNSLNTRIKQLEYLLRPEAIISATNLTGSLNPESLRDQRKKTLELEKSNLESLLQNLDSRRGSLEESVRKADILVEKIRVRFDKIIDDALNEDFENL